MELLYICSPLSAETKEEQEQNMKKAEGYMREVSKKYNCRAIAPHAYLPKFMNDNNEQEREICMKFCLDLVAMSDALVICGDVVTKGMIQEIAHARKMGIEILTYKGVY